MRGVVAQRIVRTIRKPRNKADEAIAPKPGGTGLSGRSALSRRSPMETCHGLRVASCISSRKAAVAATRDLLRGSLSAALIMRHLGRWLLWTFALLAVAFILLQGWYAAHIWWWREHAPLETALMATRISELQERHAGARLAYRWVGYDRISVALKRAVIAAEDAKFVEHEGFD